IGAHQELGITPEDNLTIMTKGYSALSGYESIASLISRGAKFDAINAQSDGQAAGVYQYFAQQGISRQNWPLVTGVDDSPIARDLSLVPLTTATAEMETCAELAVNAIHNKIESEAVEHTRVPPKLIIRESTQRQG